MMTPAATSGQRSGSFGPGSTHVHEEIAMTPDVVFLICNNGVLPAWLLLVFAPGWKWTWRVVHAAWIPLAFAAVYAGAFLSGEPVDAAGFGSLEGVMRLFTSPHAVLAGWVHYLAFDLFVGAWQVRDARRRGIPHLAVVPCLALTLMLGPLGLAAYLVLRGAIGGGGASLQETEDAQGAGGSATSRDRTTSVHSA
jgi:hypothetical protein